MALPGRTKPSYRVIQWATGKLGTEALRQIIDHPDLELAGVYVYSAGKAGIDAGELCGRPANGIKATDAVQEIIATPADFVLHMPTLGSSTDKSDREVIALLVPIAGAPDKRRRSCICFYRRERSIS